MGDWIEGEIGDEGRQVAIGKNLRQTTIQKETGLWREFVRRDLEAHGRFIMGLLVTVMALFLLGAIACGLAIRQFDLIHQRLDRIERQRFYVPEYFYPGMPTP